MHRFVLRSPNAQKQLGFLYRDYGHASHLRSALFAQNPSTKCTPRASHLFDSLSLPLSRSSLHSPLAPARGGLLRLGSHRGAHRTHEFARAPEKTLTLVLLCSFRVLLVVARRWSANSCFADACALFCQSLPRRWAYVCWFSFLLRATFSLFFESFLCPNTNVAQIIFGVTFCVVYLSLIGFYGPYVATRSTDALASP